ncbi:MAG: DNA polymerase I [Deltaproteobacteria bacterium]|jgi:DNA polymerase-1|nr:DNA polymerase I [Deltaproteobacteria bacterium]
MLLPDRERQLFLMDGSAYIFRGFYANPNMSRSDGASTSVLYMVLRLLFKIVREKTPARFAFVLDGRGPNFRHRLYADYKANRQSTPEPLAAQIAPLCAAIRALGLALIVSEDCEADDCIASLAWRFNPSMPVTILGADKDLRQCLGPRVSIWDPAGKEGKLLTLRDFEREQGFAPEYWPDYQALLGDASDNIPGVPGIGPKGANTLLREFRGLEDIFSRLTAVPPPLRKKLEGQAERAYLARELTRLQRDRCPEVDLDALRPLPPQEKELLALLRAHELSSLEREFLSMRRMDSMAAEKKGFSRNPELGAAFRHDPTPTAPQRGASSQEPSAEAPRPQKTEEERTPAAASSPCPNLNQSRQDTLLSVLQTPAIPNAESLPVMADAADLPEAESLALLPLSGAERSARLFISDGRRELLCSHADASGAALVPGLAEALASRPRLRLVVPEFKRRCEEFPALRRIPLERVFDPSLAAWLLSPEEYDYSFGHLLRRWGQELEQSGASPARPGALALALRDIMEQKLESRHQHNLLREMEMPLIPVLLDMQEAGLGIDRAAFKNFLDESQAELESLTKNIHAAAGREFNIRSTRQLGDVLYALLELPKARKTAGGQLSTAVDALEKLQGRHPIVQLILDYRRLEKLRSTYLEPLPRLADAQDRLHTSFNQSATATGRLSSSAPNLQNIPVRGPQGMRMRACFTAAPGKLLVSADYSQIELRVLAHLAHDPTLLEAFRRGEDIHSRTAALLFDLPAEKISPDQRRSAKTINFGLIYGMGAQKLAQDLGISMKEAKEFIARYFERLEALRAYFDRTEQDAGRDGFVSTMTGRRRFCPDILSANRQLRSQARRQAINTCIQGSAADIIKMAMLAVAEDAELRALGARLVLQIHDELLLECPSEHARKAGERLAAIMSGVTPGGRPLSVPLAVDYGCGSTWAEAH